MEIVFGSFIGSVIGSGAVLLTAEIFTWLRNTLSRRRLLSRLTRFDR
jgi:hypothetical protein